MSAVVSVEDRMPLSYLYLQPIHEVCNVPLDTSTTYQECGLDLPELADRILNLQEDLTKPETTLPNGHSIMVFKVDNMKIKSLMVQRDDDNPTPEDVKSHWKGVL